MIAALFVRTDGAYFGMPDVDPWDEPRDARTYEGDDPVVAHPPCQRWCKFTSIHGRVGEDEGCFASALANVRRCGGVLEHPASSKAWVAHGLASPPSSGWIPAGDDIGFTCQVEQGAYGHRAPKKTWLYAVRCDLPELKWGDSFHMRWHESVTVEWLPKWERDHTPEAFKQILLAMAKSVRRV